MDLKALTEADIERLKALHPLPEGVPDAVMNREELADAFSVSMNTVTAWINDGMPVRQTGGQGKAYELELSAAWGWRKAKQHLEEVRSDEVKRAQQAMRLALVGGGLGDTIDALDPKTKREIILAAREQEMFANQRNALLRREDVVEGFEITFALVRDALEALPDRAERKAALSPEVVAILIVASDETIQAVASKIREFWENRPLRSAARRDLLDA